MPNNMDVSDYIRNLFQNQPAIQGLIDSGNEDKVSVPMPAPKPMAAQPAPKLTGASTGVDVGMSPPVTSDLASNDDPSSLVKQAIGQKYGYGPGLDTEAIKAAQESQRQNMLGANLAEAGNDIGWAIARNPGGAQEGQKFYQNLRSQAGQPLQNIAALRQSTLQDMSAKSQMAEHDPNSEMSQNLRQLYGKLGIPPEMLEGASAADLKQYTGPAEFMAKLQSQKDLKEMQLAQIKATRDLTLSNKKDEHYTKLRDAMEKFRGNQAAQQAATGVLAADKALDMLKGKNLDKLSLQDISLLNGEIAKIATGGVPTEHGQMVLMPNNLETKAAEMKNFFASNPTEANAGDYLKHNLEYLKAIRDTSKKALDDYRRNIAKGYRNTVKPEDYAEVISDYGLNAPPAQGAHDTAQTQDPKISEWAQTHSVPYDQAASILKARGYGG